MSNPVRRGVARPRPAHYPITTRVLIGTLISLPLVGLRLATIVDSLAAGFMIAGLGAVTLIAILPHDQPSRRSGTHS